MTFTDKSTKYIRLWFSKHQSCKCRIKKIVSGIDKGTEGITIINIVMFIVDKMSSYVLCYIVKYLGENLLNFYFIVLLLLLRMAYITNPTTS